MTPDPFPQAAARGSRPVTRKLAVLLTLLTVPSLLLVPAVAAESRPAPESPNPFDDPRRILVLEEVQTVGNHRTGVETIRHYLPLSPGDRADQQAILDGVAALRQSGLFARVDFYTRPGSERGRVILVLEVEEKGAEFRLGTGNTDLDGWYLIPAALAFDNRLGRGERLDLQWKFGYRYTGLFLNFRQPRFGDGRSFWGLETSVLGSDRIYFLEGVEYSHNVQRAGVEIHLGRWFGDVLAVALGMRLESVAADSSASVYTSNAARDAQRGEELAYAELPSAIADDVGRRGRSALHLDLLIDSRSGALAAGAPADGIWGRLQVGGVFQDAGSFPEVTLDVRGYHRLGSGALAARFRASAVGSSAAFYDRLYLGGLYTVRGFPSQSLSRPEGDRWLWSTSLEYRAPLVGDPVRPRLAGLLFLDAGDSGTGTTAALRDLAVAAGWGLRLRFWWLGWLGLDVGLPLSYSPVEESFHLHASIGWTF